MRFNLNNTVRVKLTKLGHDLILENHKKLFGINASKYQPRKIEESDGWSEWQLWDLMAEFGPYIHMGCNLPFETEIDILEPEHA